MRSVNDTLKELFPDEFFASLPTHEYISRHSYSLISSSRFCFVGGTNLLSSNMNHYNQWKITLRDAFFLKNIILLGVGWWQYQNRPNIYTRTLLKRVLGKEHLHSVRDKYTEGKLKSIGINNVINTSCPTMWKLTGNHCADIPKTRSNNVLLTLTDYNKQPSDDIELLQLLGSEYRKIYFWPQGIGDEAYLKNIISLSKNLNGNIVFLQPNLESFDDILIKTDIDYIGTRLHAGIRALQHKKRTLILSIDNRSVEIQKTTKLPLLPRSNVEEVKEWINSSYNTKITLPEKNIERWKSQWK